MKESKQIIDTYIDYLQRGKYAALATVVRVEGSAYRRPGARMLIMEDGKWQGSISGGCLEGDALKKARQLMKGNSPEILTYDTTEKGAHALYLGLGCHGKIEILLEPLHTDSAENPLLRLKEYFEKEREGVMATVFNSNRLPLGTRYLYYESEPLAPAWQVYADGFAKALALGKSTNYLFEQEGDEHTEIFFEYLYPGFELHVFGAGMDVVPISEFAKILGWKVMVYDNCVAHLAPARIPKADALLHIDFCNASQNFEPGRYSAGLVMSHNYKFDANALQFLLDKPVPYVGLMGPRARFERMEGEFPELAAYTSSNRLFSPIGLDIGAENPEEIALAIVSEIKAFFAGRSGNSLRDRDQPINERQKTISIKLTALS
ncbi:xanthine dehydrogenase [Flammeovirgaceae bacterium 311]|nr:xanthine dehydrogenase [Flammeovirgaceae bacterium 311]